ncbi:MAG: NAD(P)-binding protein, partial [Fidelibacterota bacterium]
MKSANTNTLSYECCILGCGPAGLGTALELIGHGVNDIILIDRNHIVGGLARTEELDGNRYDVGPHRFFTKNDEVNRLWHEILGDDFQPVQRLTRIYYGNKYFNYPVKAFDALIKLGLNESLQTMFSFASTVLRPKAEARNFEEWVSNRFGRKL